MNFSHPLSCVRRPVSALGAIALITASLALMLAPGNAHATWYCGIWVPGNTDCARVSGGSWVDGYFDQNYVEDPNNWLVCEHTYLYGTGTTVSRRCGANPQNAATELMCYYAEGRELSGHAGNDNSFEQPIWGDAYVETVKCV